MIRHLADGRVELRVEVRPQWAFRLRRGGTRDGLLRRRGPGLQRLLHVGEEPVLAGVVQASPDRVLFGARAGCERAAAEAVDRMRFACGVDDDLERFHRRFAADPLIGRALRAAPGLRASRRPDPWEALCAAICEQLIEYDRAIAVQRRMIAAFGRRCPETGLRDHPTAQRVSEVAPARLESFDLAGRRCLTLRRAATEVACGRVDLRDADHEAGWRRLRAIPGIGSWTIETLGSLGQGRHDQLPALDVSYLKLVGRLTTGNPRARADEAEVRGLFAAYGEWAGLAGDYARYASARGLLPPAPFRLSLTRPPTPGHPRTTAGSRLSPRAAAPGRAGTRSSAPAARSAAA